MKLIRRINGKDVTLELPKNEYKRLLQNLLVRECWDADRCWLCAKTQPRTGKKHATKEIHPACTVAR